MKKQKAIVVLMIVMLTAICVFPVNAETVESAGENEVWSETEESNSFPEELLNEGAVETDGKPIEPMETNMRETVADNTDVFDDPEQKKHIEQSALEDGSIMPFSEVDSRKVEAYGIDVSSWNGVIDWQKVKNDGVEFAIIRIGYRGYGTGRIVLDDMAIRNLEGAQNAGIKIGAYFFSTAMNEQEAIEEAQFTVNVIRDYTITYPVVYDCEGYNDPDYRIYNLSKGIRTNNALAFLNYIENCGYEGMMYSSSSHFTEDNEWEISRIDPYYDVWVAQYWLGFQDEGGAFSEYPSFESLENRMTAYTGKYRMWQFSSAGIINGIDGYVDLDVEYFVSENNMRPPEEEAKVKAMYRLYNPYTSEHFYTADVNERDGLASVGWSYEGIAWYAPEIGNPVYRLYNPYVSDHHYTLSSVERDGLVQVGWIYEGIGWYSDRSNSVAVYRLYNPYTITGMHHYTTDYSEVSHLSSIGWMDEGIGWYGACQIN